MAVDLETINPDNIIRLMFNQLSRNNKSQDNQVKVQGLSDEELKKFIVDEHTHPEIEQVMDELKKLTETNDVLNRRVKLSINKEINRIIITVVDKNTDEVIREIPCRELQNLAAQLKEAIGILYDHNA
jgi:flagellar protein FlaG